MEKKHTDAEQQTCYDKLNKDLNQPPGILKKSSFFNGTQLSLVRLQERYEALEKRLAELELYCYEPTDEVGYTVSWDPAYCTPRKTQLQREHAIWRATMRPPIRTAEEIMKAVDDRPHRPTMHKPVLGSKENPIVIE